MLPVRGKSDQPEHDVEIFAIYDAKMENYSDPKFAINQHDFIRSILNTFRDPSQSQNKYLVNAEDFSLFKIGTYGWKNATLVAHPPMHVVNFHELRSTAQKLGAVGSPSLVQSGIGPT